MVLSFFGFHENRCREGSSFLWGYLKVRFYISTVRKALVKSICDVAEYNVSDGVTCAIVW